MLKQKAKRLLAGLCVALMLIQSIDEGALMALAAEPAMEIPSGEYLSQEGTEETDNAASEEAAVTSGDSTVTSGDGTITSGDSADGSIAEDFTDSRALMAGEGTDGWTEVSPGVRVNEDGVIQVLVNEETGYEDFGTIDASGVLTVKASATGIYTNMFMGWDRVTELRFEENAGAKIISLNAFKNCTNLTKIDLSNCPSLTDIGESAFFGCSGLETIIFHDNLQYIRKQAFASCTSLQGVTLTPGLISVADMAFSGCTSLSKVTLETSNLRCLTSSGSAATAIFQKCNISEVTFALRNVAGDTSKDSIIVPANLFNKAGFAESANIVIPANIQEIGESAFKDSNLGQVTFENTTGKPSALTTIGKEAFKNTKLTDITFPDTMQTIGESAFEACTGLTALVLPNSITTLGNKAFRGCTGIRSLKLPNAASTVGDYVFENATSLTEIELPEGLTFTGKGEFKGCSSLSNITLPSTLETLGDETFMSCAVIQRVTLPDKVTTLGQKAFEGCVGLISITYSDNLIEIKDRAFYNCISLTSNVFPETLEKIGASAFYNCQRFNDLTIPAKVTKIGKEAFRNCVGINILTLSDVLLDDCGSGIFNGCYLKEVRFPDGITVIPAHLFDQATFTTDCVMTIPNTVKTVGDYAFCGSKTANVNLTSIVFEEGIQLEKIGNYAFKDCIAIESFTIPETTLEIGNNAFEGCIKLSSIVIPENVTKIGASAFSGCSVLTDITYNAIEVTTSNQNIFAGCNVRTIRIGDKVRAFPANLFKGAQFSTNTSTGEEEMISINIPASVETIGEYALPNIANLQHVVFAEGSVLTKIGNYAFYQCVNMESCNLPDSVTDIGNFAFSGCTKLGSDETKSFTIPSSLVTLGSSAFSECPALTEVVIPEGVAKISDKAFMNDTGLISVLLQGGALTEIGMSAFEGCTSLAEISIPNGVTKIGATAFKNCSALAKVVIPASVTSIGKDAFAGCSGSVQYLVVPGSYAEQWLADNGLQSSSLLTITYVLGGGTNAPQNPAGYEPGETFLFAPATRKGYKFMGWYLDENLTREITGVENQTENLTVYAKWEIEVYTITYVLNGGTNHKDNPGTYTIEDTVSLKEATLDGAVFEGWYTDLSNTRSKVTSIRKGETGDKTLYAKWTRGVTLEPAASIESGSAVKAGTKLFLTSPTPGAYIYYTLDGSDPNEQSTLYADGIVISAETTIRAIAVKKGCDPSGIVEFTYSLIDETKEWGDIAPEDQGLFADASKVPEGIWVAGVEEEVVYTGQKITFDLRVYDHKTLLKEKTDYTVKYSNNLNAAAANALKKAPTVTVTAKGNYKGKVDVKFSIKPRDIRGDEFSAEDLTVKVTGRLLKPAPVLYYGKTKLKNKKDYQIVVDASDGGYTAAGTYEIKLKGIGNFTEERTLSFTLVNGTSISKAKITGLANQVYTGQPIEQDFTVKVGATILNKGTDYNVEYSNNTDAGTATVTVVGKGSYFGTKKTTFKIIPVATLNKNCFTLDKTSVDYTGNAYEIGNGINVTASLNGQPLREDVDYTCSYKSNVNVGTATVTFTGKGGYSGTVKKTFKIKSANISELADVKFLDDQGNVKQDDSYVFVYGGVKPAVQISYGGRILKEGTDYSVSYKKNTAKGSATITIKGKKNYTGTINRTFTITQQSVANLSVSATDVVWKNAAGVVETSKVIVKDVNGKEMKAGTDYKVTFAYQNNTQLANGTTKKAGVTVGKNDIVPVETLIQVKISGMGNYNGSTSTIMRVCKKSIASATVKVNPQIYTGSEVQPGMDQMTVKLGGVYLNKGDYEIVGYENNIKKGTAKVTIRGVGDYGGTKTVNFKINQKQFSLLDILFNKN